MQKFGQLLSVGLLLWLFGWLWVEERPLSAAQPEPLRNEATADFPNGVTFQLDLPQGHNIVAATLTYDIEKFSCLEVSPQVPVEVEGDSLEWRWVMSRSGNPPPGTLLWWEWTLTDAAGNVGTTPRQQMTLEDGRFAWQTVQSGDIRLHWYEGETVGPLLLEAAVSGLARLEQQMGITLQDEVNFYIYGSAEEMRDAMLFVQGWAGGLAFSEHNTILMGVPPSIAATWGVSTVQHELAHLVVGEFGRSCVGGSRPTWLNEGLAVYAEGEPANNIEEDLATGFASNSFEPVRSLSGSFSAHGTEAGIAYSQSYSVVAFLLETYGQEAMQQLLLTLAEGTDYDEALLATYGFDVDGLEQQWRAANNLPLRQIPATPTPISAANIATVVPLAAPQDVVTPTAVESATTQEVAGETAVSQPTPASAAQPAQAPSGGICGLALLPMLALAFWSGRFRFSPSTNKTWIDTDETD